MCVCVCVLTGRGFVVRILGGLNLLTTKPLPVRRHGCMINDPFGGGGMINDPFQES